MLESTVNEYHGDSMEESASSVDLHGSDWWVVVVGNGSIRDCYVLACLGTSVS